MAQGKPQMKKISPLWCSFVLPLFPRVQEAFGQHPQAQGLNFGWSCADPGDGLDDPYGSLLIWDILWFCDSPDSRDGNTSEAEWRKEPEAGKSS